MATLIPNRGIRIADEPFLKLKYLAKQDGRSFNNYVVRVLENHISQYELQHGEIEVNTDELYK